jgi:beta-phosphoglucomutase-like phosphatase (HAD superfamily)
MSPREIIDAILSATGLGGRFIATVSAREAGSKRDAYLAAVRRMAIRPSECFALEDSPGGARAAKEAGLYCVAIPNAFLKNADFSFVDEVHRSIREFLANGRVLETLAHP